MARVVNVNEIDWSMVDRAIHTFLRSAPLSMTVQPIQRKTRKKKKRGY